MSNRSSSSNRIGFFGLLQVVFITLKLTNIGPVATWSWPWVMSPMLAGVFVYLAILVVFTLGVVLSNRN